MKRINEREFILLLTASNRSKYHTSLGIAYLVANRKLIFPANRSASLSAAAAARVLAIGNVTKTLVTPLKNNRVAHVNITQKGNL